MQCCMEIMVYTFSIMYGNRFDRCTILCKPLQEMRRRTGNICSGLHIKILEMYLIHIKEGHNLNFLPVCGLNFERAFKSRIYSFCHHLLADILSGYCLNRLCFCIIYYIVTQLLPLFILQSLYIVRVIQMWSLIVLKDLVSFESLQCICPDKQREVRKLFDKIRIIPFVIHYDLCHTKEYCCIRDTGPARNPVICLCR